MDGLERPACAWCGGCEVRPRWKKDGLGIVACRRCGLVFASPRETRRAAAARYSRRDYFRTDRQLAYGYDDYAAHRDLHEQMFRQGLQRLERRLPSRGRLLDVGCALGFLLAVARERGFDPEGVDVSEWACERARRLTGLPVHQGTLGELRLPAGSFDALTAFDVVEHVHDPRAFLKEAARLLRPGGWLFLVTPNVSGWSRRLMGRFWFHFKPLEHTYYFDRRTLGRFLEEAGLEVAEVRRNRRRVTPRFVCERLRSYSRGLGRLLHGLVARWGWSERFSFPLYTGEIEILARKKSAPEA